MGTIASGRNQTAMGKYNVQDTSSLLIVCNGTSDAIRKNAFKVSSDGKGEFAGDVIAKGNSSSDTPISLINVNSLVQSLQTEIDEIEEITNEEIQSLFV